MKYRTNLLIFYVGKLNLLTIRVFIGTVRCLKYTIQLDFLIKMTFFIAQIYFFVKKKETFGRFLGDFSEKWGIFLCFRSFIYHKNTYFLFYEKIKK